MELEDYIKLLDILVVETENELDREVLDRHSDESGFNNGYNNGVGTGIELFVEKLKACVVNASDTEGLDRLDILRYKLLGTELVDIRGDGGFGGTELIFSNGDKLELIHFSHREGEPDGQI